MFERLIFDPISESSANAPLEITSPADDPIIGLVEHSYPAPPLNVLYASSIDTEGENPVSRRHGNREISMRLEVRAENYPAATNLVPNPQPGPTATPWTSGANYTNATTQTIVADSQARGEYALNVVGTGAAAAQGAEISLGTLSAGAHTVLLRLKSVSGATTLRVGIGKVPTADEQAFVTSASINTSDYTIISGTATIAGGGTYNLYIRNEAATAATWRLPTVRRSRGRS